MLILSCCEGHPATRSSVEAIAASDVSDVSDMPPMAAATAGFYVSVKERVRHRLFIQL
jgi:hypothetical protein